MEKIINTNVHTAVAEFAFFAKVEVNGHALIKLVGKKFDYSKGTPVPICSNFTIYCDNSFGPLGNYLKSKTDRKIEVTYCFSTTYGCWIATNLSFLKK